MGEAEMRQGLKHLIRLELHIDLMSHENPLMNLCFYKAKLNLNCPQEVLGINILHTGVMGG